MDGKYIRQRSSQTDEDIEMRIYNSLFFTRLLMIFLLAACTGVARAQRGQFSPEQIRERLTTQAEEMAKQLELSDEQMPMYMEIVLAGVEKRMELIGSMQGGGGFQGMREKMRELQEETTKALEDVLDEKQMKKYKDILADRQRRRRRGQG